MQGLRGLAFELCLAGVEQHGGVKRDSDLLGRRVRLEIVGALEFDPVIHRVGRQVQAQDDGLALVELARKHVALVDDGVTQRYVAYFFRAQCVEPDLERAVNAADRFLPSAVTVSSPGPALKV